VFIFFLFFGCGVHLEVNCAEITPDTVVWVL